MVERKSILKGHKHFFGKRTIPEVGLELLWPLTSSDPPLQHNIRGERIIA